VFRIDDSSEEYVGYNSAHLPSYYHLIGALCEHAADNGHERLAVGVDVVVVFVVVVVDDDDVVVMAVFIVAVFFFLISLPLLLPLLLLFLLLFLFL
jgi:hypothetical protein